jgi:hypothetical protein
MLSWSARVAKYFEDAQADDPCINCTSAITLRTSELQRHNPAAKAIGPQKPICIPQRWGSRHEGFIIFALEFSVIF